MNNVVAIADVERAILNLARAVTGDALEDVDDPDFEKWWVVACGDAFDEESFEQREAARERLRRRLTAKGVRLPEWLWVYDEESRAKVVLAECVSREEAERLAEVYRSKGLIVRVRRELPEDDACGASSDLPDGDSGG